MAQVFLLFLLQLTYFAAQVAIVLAAVAFAISYWKRKL